MDDTVPPKLLSLLSSAAGAVRTHDNVHIFSHHDADGISAAVILARTMMRANIGFKVTLLPALNDDTVKEIMDSGSKCIIIADMGSSYLEELDTVNGDVVILDHHKYQEAELKNVKHINPHSFGIDGMTAACGASMALLFSVEFDKNNWDLVQTAFAGIVGDKQHQKGLEGINKYLFAEGNKKGYVTKAEGQLIPSGPLMSSLFLSVDPYIRGVSGNADGVAELLGDAGADVTASSSDLNDAARRKLSSLIASKLLAQNVTRETMEDVASVRYVLKNWIVDAEAFASVLNSCGRTGTGSVGIGFGMGDKECTRLAHDHDTEVRKKILFAATELDSKGLQKTDSIQFFDSSSSGSTGMLCEIAMRFFGDPDKPVIGYSVSEGMTKASARCTHALLKKGVDLSVAMRTAGEAVGGGGGGHMVASGAWFPAGKEKEFLAALDAIVKEQVSAR